ncbi:hypothetical protein SD457_00035 [Coprobacillaceae bacterium CR2/5/TPMF4]|nr:hypothetical protein SD457_00035 [Coprobacillaceae bacterium CR2/5/TPMF4]
MTGKNDDKKGEKAGRDKKVKKVFTKERGCGRLIGHSREGARFKGRAERKSKKELTNERKECRIK